MRPQGDGFLHLNVGDPMRSFRDEIIKDFFEDLLKSKIAGLMRLVFCFNLDNQLGKADNRKLPQRAKQLFTQKVKGVHNIESKEPTLCTPQVERGVMWKRSNSPLPLHHLIWT